MESRLMDELNIFAHYCPHAPFFNHLSSHWFSLFFFRPEFPNLICIFCALDEHCRCKLSTFDEFPFFLSLTRCLKNEKIMDWCLLSMVSILYSVLQSEGRKKRWFKRCRWNSECGKCYKWNNTRNSMDGHTEKRMTQNVIV